VRIPVDDEVAIEVLEVPAQPRFAASGRSRRTARSRPVRARQRDRGVGRGAAQRRGSGRRAAARALLPRAARREGRERSGVAALCEKLGCSTSATRSPCPRAPADAAQALRELLTRLLP
jgi:hypothetical protein